MAGLLLPLAILANFAEAFVARENTNAVTQNWSLQPENWEALRRQWEYSHAANAGMTLLAFCLAAVAALTTLASGVDGYR